MEFLRPEAVSQIRKWREALTGLGVFGLGAWGALGIGGLMILPGAGGLALGVALVWIGVQRARFRTGGQGPGLVQVDEGQITYLGPVGGGMIAVQDISRICLDRTGLQPQWRLERAQGADVAVPVDAEGADALFDAFAQLPDLSPERLIAALHGPQNKPQNGPGAGLAVVWQRRRLNASLR